MTKRKSYTVAQRRKIWEEAQDKDGNVACWRCEQRIDPIKEKWHVGHVGVAHAFGGEKVAPEHVKCNMKDCYEVVIPMVAKSNRIWASHHGQKQSRNPMSGSKGSRLKRKMDGTIVDRATGKIISRRRA